MTARLLSARRGRGSVRRAASVIATSMVVLATALPAHAGRPLVHERYSETDSFIACDFYEVESTFEGFFMIKDARPSTQGQFFEFQVREKYSDVWTNPETGDFFTLSGNWFGKELKPRLVEGTIYTFEFIQAGQPFVITDMTGRVVLRDRGLIRLSLLFDLLGDGEPGGVFLDASVVRVSGPHPGFAEDFDLCEFADELIG
jgi:hypothetical protein